MSDSELAEARAVAHYAAGIIEENTGRAPYADALDEYAKAAELDPHTYLPYARAAALLLSDRKYDEAISTLGRAVSKNPRNVQALADLAVICEASNRDDEAVRHYRAAIALNPESEALYCRAARACFAGGRDSAAAGWLLKGHSRSEHPEVVAFYCYGRGVEFVSAKEIGRAVTCFEALMKMLPGDPSIMLSAAMMFSQEQEYGRAIRLFGQAESAAARKEARLGALFYLQYGAACERAGRIGQAAEVFKRGLASHPDDHAILNYLAYMWADANVNLPESETLAARAVELAPDNGAYADTLGWVFFRQGRHDEALKLIRLADALIPSDPTILDHLGDALEAGGRKEEAVDAWRRSYILDSSNSRVRGKLKANGVEPSSIAANGSAGKNGGPDRPKE